MGATPLQEFKIVGPGEANEFSKIVILPPLRALGSLMNERPFSRGASKSRDVRIWVT